MCLDSRRAFRRNGGHGAVNAERESADTFADATFSAQLQAVGPVPMDGLLFHPATQPSRLPTMRGLPFFQLFAANRRHVPTTKSGVWAEPTSQCPRERTVGRPLLAAR
ncbi:hypothetical protein LMG28727_07502 [Paraburkholderia kirstenboschensis]|nr:hypothetical protein LMG28727_07502 [Paraburkholderia kirstenboschensis]